MLLMTRQAPNSRASVRPSYIFPYQHTEPPGTRLAWTATSSSFRCMVYAVLTWIWNSACSVARTSLGIRKSISSIDIGERDVIVMIGVY
jgi:hypothetical protein